MKPAFQFPPQPSLSDRTLSHDLLRRMKLIRAVENEIASRYHQQKMRCPVHLSIGQEAVAAGTGIALQRKDQVVSTHRSHAHYIGKGGDIPAMVSELYGKATGCSSGKGGSMHLTDLSVNYYCSTAIVGNSIPIGVGIALTNQLKKHNRASCIYLGDASIEEGVFHESANFAALKNLPALFVCENNLYSVYSHINVRQPNGRKIADIASALGIPAYQGDGNNVWEVYHLTSLALNYIRQGNGPVFLEFATYRWREHCGPNYDNKLGYRTETEFNKWKKLDPLSQFEDLLSTQNQISSEELRAIDHEITNIVTASFNFAEESPFPTPADAFKHLFKES